MKRLAERKPLKFLCFIFYLFCSFLCLSQAFALEFGDNKIRYHTDHHWKIFETEHFEIYYYQECESVARTATQYAENAFLETSKKFDFVPKTKIPLFIYGTSLEFQETNITPQVLSEGVGGFTEVFKNRIAVPMEGSYHEFQKVLQHELTHAFQYDLIYGEGWRSVNLFKAVFVPNWMMEGMAEWNAQHVEGQGEMVLRDAIINDRVIPLNLLESFDHFEQVYMAYKESQSILDYISQVYGPEKVPQIFKRMASNQQADVALKNVLGIPLNDLYENWHFFVKSKAWARIAGMPAPEKYGEILENEIMKASVSPDGLRIAYLKGDELGLISLPDKKKTVLLHRHFQTKGSGVAWAPDGKFLAFAATEEGEYRLYTYDLEKELVHKCEIPKLPVVFSPAWSPDQKFILFSGFDYTNTDLYRYEVSDSHTLRLTNDMDTKTFGQYGPDGKAVYFIDEKGGQEEIKKISLGENGDPVGSPVSFQKNLGMITSLVVRPTGFYFTTNLNRRIFNIFQMDPKGEHLVQLTNTFADVLSASPDPDSQRLYAVVYRKAVENLFTMDMSKIEKIDWPLSSLSNLTRDSSYISNSFENASMVIAANPLKDGTAETEVSSNFEKIEPEGEKDKKNATQVPSALTHLEVTEASNIVQLQWPVTMEDFEPVDSYRVYRSTAAGATFTYLGDTTNVRKGKYVDYGVQGGDTYFYYVTALNKAGESAPSPVVEVHPAFKVTSKEYHLKLSPDILLFLAGYDSSFGFVGGGILQLSDYLGDHRLGILGDTIPSVRTGVEANYEFSAWRTNVDLNFFYFQNFFRIFDLQTGSIVNEYRNNENGIDLNFSYPLNTTTRFEYGIGTQRFQGSPLFLRFSEGISNYFQNSDQWNIANYYRISFVKDKRRATQFWPSSGYALNFTLLHAVPVLDSNVSFANLLFETQFYADIGFLNHLIWANRFIAMTSQGPNPQSFFIGNDAPFQAFFTTIRGFGGSTFFGTNLGLFNTELRYPIATNLNFALQPLSFILIKDIELAGFLDAGIASNQLQDLPNSPVFTSIGTGIRFYSFIYQRALVMFRFDVAWRLDQAASPTFHFNLVPMF